MSPFRATGSFYRKTSNSSNLYFDSAGLSRATLGRGGSLGNVWPNHLAQDFNSTSHWSLSAPKLRPFHWRSSSIACQRSPGLDSVGTATIRARYGAASSGFGFAGNLRRADSASPL